MVTISTAGFQGTNFKLEILDILGQSVYLNEAIQSDNFRLDISTFVEGVYFVKMSNGTYQAMQRLVINR